MNRLAECKTRHQVGEWIVSQGLHVGENKDFGIVYPVHVRWTSFHYHVFDQTAGVQLGKKEMVSGVLTPQGNLAFDVNYYGGGRWDTEPEALLWLFRRIHDQSKDAKWPLAEMFFSTKGFIAALGYDVNHPISGHDDHCHIAFNRDVL
jgi:hypothetical protein